MTIPGPPQGARRSLFPSAVVCKPLFRKPSNRLIIVLVVFPAMHLLGVHSSGVGVPDQGHHTLTRHAHQPKNTVDGIKQRLIVGEGEIWPPSLDCLKQ